MSLVKKDYITENSAFAVWLYSPDRSKIWVRANDVLSILEHANPREMMDTIDYGENGKILWSHLMVPNTPSADRCEPNTLFVAEQAFNELCARSQASHASNFRDWATLNVFKSLGPECPTDSNKDDLINRCQQLLLNSLQLHEMLAAMNLRLTQNLLDIGTARDLLASGEHRNRY